MVSIMGNIGSQTGHINQFSEEQWNYSFPRAQTTTFYQQHHKVLPDRDARQRLRPTNNGEILQSGGTLTGRQNQNRITLPKEVQIKRCDSAPDLRFPPKITLDHNKDAIKSKKKYKAPSPPKMRNQTQWDTNRKPRLFKTRLETIKNNSSPINKAVENVKYNCKNDINQLDTTDYINKTKKITKTEDNQLSQQQQQQQQQQQKRHLNTIDFKDELQMVTSNLKYNHINNKMNEKNDFKEKLKTLDHNINGKKHKKPIKDDDNHKINAELSENQLNTDDFNDDFDKIEPDITITEKKQEPKTFYFGMEETMNYTVDNNINYEINLNNNNNDNDASSFESDLSSWTENNNINTNNNDLQVSKSGIDLKLRPILPKKPLEIPRFSPAAAWRLLSTMNFNDQNGSTLASDDCPVFVEERIEKYSRPPPPTIQVARFSNDKSGDSGISGDAGPAVFDDGADITLVNKLEIPGQFHNRHPHRSSWTPQQDLEDDSSMEEYLNNENEPYKEIQPNEVTTKPHVFSLSLPRDNHLASYLLEKSENTNNTGLKKLKRSVSGVLGNLSKRDFTTPNLTQEQSDNWLLSKSAANSLTNGFNSLEMRYSQKSDEFKNILATNKTQNGGRVMYLPECDGNYRKNRTNARDNIRYRSRSMERVKNSNQLTVYSKSCENITAELQSSSTHSEPEDLQDPTTNLAYQKPDHIESNKKPRKFTFQSTIRQIERKIIAEKLSREAERKEKQRLREVEAMRKVEEEFQKKRAREKAAIRQQLRMYTGNDVPWSSLPSNIDTNREKILTRTEPDGATSSSPTTSSPTLPLKNGFSDQRTSKVYQKNKRTQDNINIKAKLATNSNQQKIKTQILSEYKQPQRDYKEYRTSSKYANNNRNKYTTKVYPQVQCDMPKFKKY